MPPFNTGADGAFDDFGVKFSKALTFEVNGIGAANPDREGHLTKADAIGAQRALRASYALALGIDELSLTKSADEMNKTVSIATGLINIDLRGPAEYLVPTITPIRNRFGRVTRPNPGNALQYKTITSVQGSGFNWMPWVPEGSRAGKMSYTANSIAVPYVTIGEEDAITEEAREAARGFEDEDAMVQLRTLLKLMTKEEAALLGGAGSAGAALGTPSLPVLSAAGSVGTLPALTYSVICVALNVMGNLHSTLATGVATTVSVTPQIGTAFNLNGGSSNKSASATQAITLGQILSATVTPVVGAVAYAWFVGAVGSETVQLITSINSATFSAPLAGGRQAATAITVDCSINLGKAYDGFLTTAFVQAQLGNAYVMTLGTGVAGAGVQMSSSGYGSVNEIDIALKAQYDQFRTGPTVIYVSSQEQRSITKLSLLGTGGAPLLRYNIEAGGDSEVNFTGIAGNVVSLYYNPYTGLKIPVLVHPNMPAGTIMMICETLPSWYVSNETPVVAQVICRKDYYTKDWAPTQRQQEYGVYAQNALAIFAPFAIALITNIAPTP